MSSLVREARVMERLLVWPVRVSGAIGSLFTRQFSTGLGLCQYVSKNIFKSNTMCLMITLDCFECLKNDPVFQFPQVKYILVICDTIDDVNEMQLRVTPITDKVKFYTIDDLLKWPREPELDVIFGSLDSIDQSIKEALLSLNKDRLDPTRRTIFNRLSFALNQLPTNPLHGLPVKNINDFTSNFICQSCALINEKPYQLECEHYLCEGCLNTRESCAICQTTISHNEEHFKQNHLDLITCLIENQQAIGNVYDFSSLNGTCLWKILNIDQMLKKGISGEINSIYSPPFYLYRHGYKICFRLYFNGDQKGRNTHMSMFLVLMPGEYDEDLRWPFSLKVTFSLIDQSIEHDEKHHISQFCWPDTAEICFGYPKLSWNLPYGISQCFSLEELKKNQNKFIHDDTMFFQIQFEISTEIPTNGLGEKPSDQPHTGGPDDELSRLIGI
ncbi:unnamed protein product [Adineta steineri]|uniref:Uncharacterized protein n=1 Tax=Adineta steineri TaxID=433720 RepID=A0A815YRP5_9BILA|nr:unnamed protein product [Adineta steineri]CAF1574046.1 unnamed protein product [Adineta steineri]